MNAPEPLIATRQQLRDVCTALAAANDPHLPLMQAASDGRIALGWAIRPGAGWPFQAVAAVQRPAVFLIGDDPWPNGEAVGPAGWDALARQLRTWARSVIVHGGAGAPEHYREAVRAAELTGRCAMIETGSVWVEAWGRYLACPATLLIKPADGVAHPMRRAEGAVH